MRIARLFGALALAMLATGCATRQETLLAKASGLGPITSVVRMPETGNSSAMDESLRSAVERQGIAFRGHTAEGTQKSQDADAVISYVDVWRWDLAMYLQSLTVRLYDARTGDLIISGSWHDSPLHGFRDYNAAMDSVVSEMFDRLKKIRTSN